MTCLDLVTRATPCLGLPRLDCRGSRSGEEGPINIRLTTDLCGDTFVLMIEVMAMLLLQPN